MYRNKFNPPVPDLSTTPMDWCGDLSPASRGLGAGGLTNGKM